MSKIDYQAVFESFTMTNNPNNFILNRFLPRVDFADWDDFKNNFNINVPDNFNFAYDVIDAWAEAFPHKKAMCWINDEGKHIDFTFNDFKTFSDKTASYFQSLGIKKGDTVMLILKRRYEFWFSILALHKLGAIVIPATHLLTDHDITYRVKAANIKMIVSCGDETIITHIENSKKECESLEHLVSIGPVIPYGWENFHQDIEKAAPFTRPENVTQNDDISLIYFTSGTSGAPKMVAHNFLYPLGHIVTAKYWHNLDCDSLHLTISDTGWGKAVWGKLYGQWLVGANIFVYDHEKFTPLDILKIIEKHKITSFCAPPTVFRFMIKENIREFDLSSLKWCTIAGEALNPAVYDMFYELTGIKLHEGFGQTETTLTIATSKYTEPKPGSMGIPTPLYDVDIVNDEGVSTKPGEHGTIIIRIHDNKKPLGLFHGYYLDEELTKSVVVDGIYNTGDVAWRDKEGYFWFIGRSDDIIKSSGYRISPFEVESVLMQHEAVVECAVTGVPDVMRGAVVKATVVLGAKFKDADQKKLARQIQQFVKKNTASYKYPRVIEFVDQLPKTISGKVRRVEIRKKG